MGLKSLVCPNCHRFRTQVELTRTPLDKQVSRINTKRRSFTPWKAPPRRVWEETIERTVNVELVVRMCKRCGHTWTTKVSSRPTIEKSVRELDPREWEFFDGPF